MEILYIFNVYKQKHKKKNINSIIVCSILVRSLFILIPGLLKVYRVDSRIKHEDKWCMEIDDTDRMHTNK